MLCEIILAVGLNFGCVDLPPPPSRDLVAEALVEQEKREREETAAALAKRDKLYRKSEPCTDCPRLNTLPFPVKD